MSRSPERRPSRAPRQSACAHCGQPVPAGAARMALVPDSSMVDSGDLGRHGQRVVIACSDDHLSALIDRARLAWVDEEWWFGLLWEASARPEMRDAPLARVGARARLSARQVDAALDWNTRRTQPRSFLPGGQFLLPRQRDRATGECAAKQGEEQR
ncbi:hypothetical protein GCM10027258_39930 [Amycolatopsis stemonae]